MFFEYIGKSLNWIMWFFSGFYIRGIRGTGAIAEVVSLAALIIALSIAITVIFFIIRRYLKVDAKKYLIPAATAFVFSYGITTHFLYFIFGIKTNIVVFLAAFYPKYFGAITVVLQIVAWTILFRKHNKRLTLFLSAFSVLCGILVPFIIHAQFVQRLFFMGPSDLLVYSALSIYLLGVILAFIFLSKRYFYQIIINIVLLIIAVAYIVHLGGYRSIGEHLINIALLIPIFVLPFLIAINVIYLVIKKYFSKK